LDIDNKSAGTA